MPEGMGCHVPMKLGEQNSELNHSCQRTRRLRRGIVGASNTDFHQIHIITWLVRQVVRCNDASLSPDCDKQGLQSVSCQLDLSSRSQRLTRIQFSCIPQVAPRHRGNGCQTRWSVSAGSLLIITVASVSSSSGSKTLLLLLPWLPLPPWLPKQMKTLVNKPIGTENTIILGCMPRLVVSRGPRENPTRSEARGSATLVVLEVPQVYRAIPPPELSCDPVRRPWRRYSHDRPYLALRARQAWPPSLAPPPVPPRPR